MWHDALRAVGLAGPTLLQIETSSTFGSSAKRGNQYGVWFYMPVLDTSSDSH